MTKIQIFIATLFISALIAGGVALALYNYHDCIKVGHSQFYCIIHFGS